MQKNICWLLLLLFYCLIGLCNVYIPVLCIISYFISFFFMLESLFNWHAIVFSFVCSLNFLLCILLSNCLVFVIPCLFGCSCNNVASGEVEVIQDHRWDHDLLAVADVIVQAIAVVEATGRSWAKMWHVLSVFSHSVIHFWLNISWFYK